MDTILGAGRLAGRREWLQRPVGLANRVAAFGWPWLVPWPALDRSLAVRWLALGGLALGVLALGAWLAGRADRIAHRPGNLLLQRAALCLSGDQ